jgi:hypothetical protein
MSTELCLELPDEMSFEYWDDLEKEAIRQEKNEDFFFIPDDV